MREEKKKEVLMRFKRHIENGGETAVGEARVLGGKPGCWGRWIFWEQRGKFAEEVQEAGLHFPHVSIS